ISPTLRSKLAGWICSSNIGVRAVILPVEIRSLISWDGSTPAFTPRVEAASSGKRPCSEVWASRGILVLRLLAFRPLREASGALREACPIASDARKVSDQLRFHRWSCQRQSHRMGVPTSTFLARVGRQRFCLGSGGASSTDECVCPYVNGYSFSEQLQSAGGTCAIRKSATRLY